MEMSTVEMMPICPHSPLPCGNSNFWRRLTPALFNSLLPYPFIWTFFIPFFDNTFQDNIDILSIKVNFFGVYPYSDKHIKIHFILKIVY